MVGEYRAVKPTVFWLEWPEEVRALVCLEANPEGPITNSDLEMAGMLLLWLVIEVTVSDLECKHFGLLDDNSPILSWVEK